MTPNTSAQTALDIASQRDPVTSTVPSGDHDRIRWQVKQLLQASAAVFISRLLRQRMDGKSLFPLLKFNRPTSIYRRIYPRQDHAEPWFTLFEIHLIRSIAPPLVEAETSIRVISCQL